MNEEAIVELTTPPLPYYLGSGRSDFQIGEQHPNRSKLGIYDLLFVCSGELNIGENGRSWSLTYGDTLLLLPNGDHYSIKPCTQATSFYWVHFNQPTTETTTEFDPVYQSLYTSRPFSNPHQIRLPKQTSLSNPKEAFKLIQQLQQLPMDRSFWEEQRLFSELLMMLEKGAVPYEHSVTSRSAEQTAAYIQKHYKEKITNELLASELHFHPNYIVRCMKTTYGKTPSEYLHDLRIQHSKRLLITTEWSIDRIAEEVGFRYAPYFSSCFKRCVGISPLSFRKQYFN